MTLALAACGGAAPDEASSSIDSGSLVMVDETTPDEDSVAPADSSDAGEAEPAEAAPASQTAELATVADVAAVCEGTAFSNLTPDTAGPRKIAFAENYKNAEGAFSLAADVSLGDAQYDYSGDDLLNLDYVGCVVEVSRERSELECAVTAEDGSAVAVEAYELNLALRIVDASTGSEVAVEPIAASLDECPTEIPPDPMVLAPIDGDGLLLATESHLAR